MENSKAKEVYFAPEDVSAPLRLRKHVDEPFLVLVLLLLAVGLICLFSASFSEAYHRHGGNSMMYITRQGMFAGIGIAAMILISRFNYRKLHYVAIPSMIVTLIMLASIKILPSIWVTSNKATRWIDLGFTQFQPSEVAKAAVILCFASLVTITGVQRMKKFTRGILPYLLMMGAIAGLLYLQPHLSATVIIIVIGVVIIFLGGASMKWLFGIGAAGAAGVTAFILSKGYALDRITAWLDPFSDMTGDGWQAAQSLMAIGSGGFWGLGLGQSRQKHLFLPEPANDFIFSVICEELGYIGAILILLLFVALIWRGYHIARNAGDRFGTLLAAGITTQIAVQAIFNIGVVTGLLPVTGASLPFFSYGGSSLFMLLCEMGIMLNISRQMPLKREG